MEVKMSVSTRVARSRSRSPTRTVETLAMGMQAIHLGGDESGHECAMCEAQMEKAMYADWSHWLCIAQDEESMHLVQEKFGLCIKYGEGTTLLSKQGRGMNVLMCKQCMEKYMKFFGEIAEATIVDDLPKNAENMANVSPVEWLLCKTLARLLCETLRRKLKDINAKR